MDHGANASQKAAPRLQKLTHPVQDGRFVVKRHHDYLSRDDSPAVTWVAGPVASGKTALLATWSKRQDAPVLWYRFDEEDAQVRAFFRFLGLAAEQHVAGACKRLPAFDPAADEPLVTFATRYFRRLFELLPRPMVLVFDGYRSGAATEQLNTVLRACFEALPPGFRVLVGSRSNLPATLFALRTGGRVGVMDQQMLALTEAEYDAYLAWRGVSGFLGPAVKQQLIDLTEGWWGGIALAVDAFIVRHGQISDDEAVTLWDEAVYGLLDGEIFAVQEPAIQDFLIRTAFVSRINVDVAEELTRNVCSDRVLAALCEQHAFLYKDGARGGRYRYAPMFRRFLRSKAAERMDEAELRHLCERTRVSLLGCGDIEGVAELLMAAGDMPGLVRLIVKQAHGLIMSGRRNVLLAWMDTMPEQIVAGHPWLLFWRAKAEHGDDVTAARRTMSEARERFTALGDLGGAHLVSHLLAEPRWQDDEARDTLHAPPLDAYRDGAELQAVYGVLSSELFSHPNDEEWRRWIQRAEHLLLSEAPVDLRLLLANMLLAYYVRWRGDLDRIGWIMDQVRPLVRSGRLSPMMQLLWQFMRATHAWLTNHPEDAERYARDGLDLAGQERIHGMDPFLLASRLYACLFRGDLACAAELLPELHDSFSSSRGVECGMYHQLAAWVDLIKGDLRTAREHAQTALTHAQTCGDVVGEMYFRLSLAQVMLESKDEALALRHAVGALRMAKGFDNGFVQLNYLLFKAQYYLLHRNDQRRGLWTLGRALRLARARGYVTHPGYGWHRARLQQLLVIAVGHDVEADYAAHLLSERHLESGDAAIPVAQAHGQVSVRVFQGFEVVRGGQVCKISGKPLSLLKLLVFSRGRQLSKDEVIDKLWPDTDPDAAQRSLDMALYRLRKQLDIGKAVHLNGGKLKVQSGLLWVDLWAVEDQVEKIEHALTFGESDQALRKQINQLFPLVAGADGDDAADTDEGMAHATHVRWRCALLLEKVGTHWESQGQWKEAIDAYHYGLMLEPANEGFYQRLMLCYQRLGRRSEAVMTYRRCVAALARLMDLSPSPETEAIYRRI